MKQHFWKTLWTARATHVGDRYFRKKLEFYSVNLARPVHQYLHMYVGEIIIRDNNH